MYLNCLFETLWATSRVISNDCSTIFTELPFGELLDYRRSTLFVPLARLPELHFLLRSIPDQDLFSMRNQGRMVFSNYLGSTKNIILTALNALRHRLGIQASAFVETQSAKVYDEATNPAPMMDTLPPSDAEAENLGPLEPPRPSPQFTVRPFVALSYCDFWGFMSCLCTTLQSMKNCKTH